MASYFLCHDANISFAELSLSLLFFFFFCFSTQNRFFLPGAAGWGGAGAGAAPRSLGGMLHQSIPPQPRLARSGATAVLPRSLSLNAAAAPGGLGCAPRTPTRPRLRALAGERVTRRWPTGGPSPRALSEPGRPPRCPVSSRPSAIPCQSRGYLGGRRRPFREQGFQIQVRFSPKAYARYLRYPCEWRRKTKNSAKSLTNASAFKH